MNISAEQLADGVTRISLSGRMDIEGVAGIEPQFAAMTAEPRKAIVVDMSNVPYMASKGIAALLIHAKEVHKRGGRLVLLGPQADVSRVLVTTGIDKLIDICADVDEALARVVL